jgi:hypothetical protein
MTNDERSPNEEIRKDLATVACSLVIRASSFLRHSSFELRHFDLVPDFVHLGQLHFAQFPAARFEFVL